MMEVKENQNLIKAGQWFPPSSVTAAWSVFRSPSKVITFHDPHLEKIISNSVFYI